MRELVKIILPKKNLFQRKFIQVYINKQPFFRMSEHDSSDKNLLGKLLKEAKVPYEIGYMAPLMRGKDYNMVGNGEINSNGKEFILSQSSCCELGPNQKHLDDLAQYLPKEIKLKIMKK